jgi:hypothetical protein
MWRLPIVHFPLSAHRSTRTVVEGDVGGSRVETANEIAAAVGALKRLLQTHGDNWRGYDRRHRVVRLGPRHHGWAGLPSSIRNWLTRDLHRGEHIHDVGVWLRSTPGTAANPGCPDRWQRAGESTRLMGLSRRPEDCRLGKDLDQYRLILRPTFIRARICSSGAICVEAVVGPKGGTDAPRHPLRNSRP